MKKLFFAAFLGVASLYSAQFNITIQADPAFKAKEAYFYTLSGSKDVLVSRVQKVNNAWQLKYPNRYTGMMKAYFPENNSSLNFISENKDVRISVETNGEKIKMVNYLDRSNQLMDEVQSQSRNRQYILPVLYQMQEYYSPASEFGKAMDKEILALSTAKTVDAAKNPFVNFYNSNYNKFLVENPAVKISQDDIINFISKSDEMLESSSLLRPVLTDYVKNAQSNMEPAVDRMLTAINVESPRGQTVLSEFIELFDTYGMNSLKEKFLAQAKNMKCTIFDRLASTIQANKNTEIGAVFPNYTFVNPINTKAKTIHDVKAGKKLIIFWSSTCSHCETELPQLIPFYSSLKSKNVEIVGLSLDADKNSYQKKAGNYPWINDSELKGWYSSFADTYNVHATPSYFILDANNKIIAKPDHVGDVISALGVK